MSDQRPQFGEYATVEEQRRLAGLPPLDAEPVEPVAVDAVEPTASEPARRSPVDRFATIALLAYGLVNVLSSAAAYMDLPRLMDETLRIMGIEGTFTNFAQGRVWGAIAAVVLVIGYAVTVWLSVKRLRTGKVTWWVPLVGAAATMMVVSICVTIPLIQDPIFTNLLTGP